MHNKITTGFARGLDSHSSSHEMSSDFRPPEMELSSIHKFEKPSNSSVEQFLKVALNDRCKFCKERDDRSLVEICQCSKDNQAHLQCLSEHKREECRDCGSRYKRQSDRKERSVLVSMESPSQQVYSTPRGASSLSESSGEERMRRIIKAATLKPHCRLCKSSEEKLIYPCQCHTVDPPEAWAHRGCILDYILMKQSDVCQKCKAPYVFSGDYAKQWVCHHEATLSSFGLKLGIGFLGLLMCIVLIIYLADRDFDDTEDVFKWILVGGLIIAAVLDCFYIGLVVFTSIYTYKINGIQVLCQKQEIAKMTSKSHAIFLEFLKSLKLPQKIPEVLQVSKKKSSVKVSEESENEEGSKLLSKSDFENENFESEGIREHSEAIMSEMVHISLLSEDRSSQA